MAINFYALRNWLSVVILAAANRVAHRLAKRPIPNLDGDRELEWTYVAARIGRYADKRSYILDFGAGAYKYLTYAAASVGRRVLAIDLTPQRFVDNYPNIEFRQQDVMNLDERVECFDLILNCSTIEHVGISGRYNSLDSPDVDLEAMKKMRKLLKPGGHMLLTLPIGRDAVIKPFHRIYGEIRLPRLLDGYKCIESSYWRKEKHDNVWKPCSYGEAVVEEGTRYYYAMGFMVLERQ